ncbi:MAG: PAS domain S-box protein [Acidobacteria bacterium]|nr:PAS domain S-box protein [Acidobacteriota bacterium]MBI3473253.1 PAS domain S-box protein [Candidatus Solibacter usitatus]
MTSGKSRTVSIALTALGVLAIHAFAQTPFEIPIVGILMCFAVSYTTSLGGARWGTVTALGSLFYEANLLAMPGTLLQFTGDNLLRLVITALNLPFALLLTVYMKSRMERQAYDKATLTVSGKALRQGEQYFRTFADEAPAMLWLADPQGARTFFNRAWLSFGGRSVQEEAGRGWVYRLHPEDLGAGLYTFLTACQSRQAYTLEYRLRRASGEYGWIRETASPRFSPAGGYLGLVGCCEDISGQKRAEAGAQESDNRFQILFEHGSAAWLEVDARGVIRRANHAACLLLETQREAMLGRLVGEVAAPEARELSGEEMARRGNSQLPFDVFSVERFLRNGRSARLEVQATALRQADGAHGGYLMVLLDRAGQPSSLGQRLQQEGLRHLAQAALKDAGPRLVASPLR